MNERYRGSDSGTTPEVEIYRLVEELNLFFARNLEELTDVERDRIAKRVAEISRRMRKRMAMLEGRQPVQKVNGVLSVLSGDAPLFRRDVGTPLTGAKLRSRVHNMGFALLARVLDETNEFLTPEDFGCVLRVFIWDRMRITKKKFVEQCPVSDDVVTRLLKNAGNEDRVNPMEWTSAQKELRRWVHDEARRGSGTAK